MNDGGVMSSVTPEEKVGSALAGENARVGVTILELRYGLEDKPGPIAAILFGFQHVLVMFTAMVAAPLVIGQLLNLPAELRATMLTGVMLGCGIGTIISALGLGFIGARLPIVLGAFAVYIGPVVAMAKATSLAGASTAMLIGGLVLFAASPIIGKMRALFPPVVVGTLLIITGITLIRIAVNIAAGVNTPYAGNPLAFALTVGSIALILAINRLTRGFWRALSVFIALVCLYLISIPLGLANFSLVANAAWFQIPSIEPYGWFVWPQTSGLIIVIVYHLVAAIYTMSITLALCKMLGVEGTERRVRGAVAADGLGSAIAVLFGGVPLISYDQNVGAISLTGVASRFVVAVAGAILIFMALVPKIGALIAIVPPFVLGGTLIFMFGMIAAVGVGILADSMRSQRDLLLLAASVGLAMAVDFAPPTLFDQVTPSLRILASDGIVIGTVMAVLLNLLLPDKD
jgi:NCS2 family nucleobase:cation symporter-2